MFRRGVSTTVAELLLVVLVVAVAIILWLFLGGFFGRASAYGDLKVAAAVAKLYSPSNLASPSSLVVTFRIENGYNQPINVTGVSLLDVSASCRMKPSYVYLKPGASATASAVCTAENRTFGDNGNSQKQYIRVYSYLNYTGAPAPQPGFSVYDTYSVVVSGIPLSGALPISSYLGRGSKYILVAPLAVSVSRKEGLDIGSNIITVPSPTTITRTVAVEPGVYNFSICGTSGRSRAVACITGSLFWMGR